MKEQTYRVGTFTERRPRSLLIMAYTRDYNRSWRGCVEYVVDASNGAEARKKAKQLRRAAEMAKDERGAP